MLSKAFVDFSTSGLENPLSHVLIILSVVLSAKLSEKITPGYLLCFFLNASCLYLNRPDLLLTIFPLILYVMFKSREYPKVLCKSIFIGIIPALIWTIFSLYYYGFLFPNTAYAKLGSNIPFSEQVEQGFIYLFDSIGKDPITLGLIGLGIFLGFCTSVFDACISIGILIYLAYIVAIGGDFMTGRFLTEIFVLSAIILARCKINRFQFILISISIVILGLMSIQSTLLSNNNYTDGVIQKNGLADERAFYFKKFGLVNLSRNIFFPTKKTSTCNKRFLSSVVV